MIDLIAITRWNFAIARSRADYARAPRRTCTAQMCSELRVDHPRLCPIHEKKRAGVLERLRQRREKP